MLPFLEVSHLAPSTSFYAAVCQPLGLKYLSSSTDEATRLPSAFFGPVNTLRPCFRIVQAASPSDLRFSRLVLSASSPDVVGDFHACTLRAHPQSNAFIDASASASGSQAGTEYQGVDRDRIRAKISDLDGNTMEVVYVPPPDYPSHYGGSTVRRTQSTGDEVSRILNWNFDVASSSPAVRAGSIAPSRRSSRFSAVDEPYTVLRRSTTTTTSMHEPVTSPRQNSKGISAAGITGIIGAAAVGAVAGAAISYTMINRDRDRAPRQEFEAAPFHRRSTFADAYSTSRDPFSGLDRKMDKMSFTQEYPPSASRAGAPAYLAQYSHGSIYGEPEDAYDDMRSRYSTTRSSKHGRTRSEAPLTRREPLLLTDHEHRSQVGSRYSAAPPPPVRRAATYDDGDRKTYVSTRSRRSSGTARPPPASASRAPSAVVLPVRSKAESRVSAATIKASREYSRAQSHVSARHVPLPMSVAPSRVSARDIPLPPSVAGGGGGSRVSARHVPLPASAAGTSHAGWDDDLESLAPSDSISCVGSRSSRSRRSRH